MKKPIGQVLHCFDKIGVVIIKFNKKIKIGEIIRFKGAHTDFPQKIESMQFDHKDIVSANKGQEVGIKVNKKVHDNDKVYEEE